MLSKIGKIKLFSIAVNNDIHPPKMFRNIYL